MSDVGCLPERLDHGPLQHLAQAPPAGGEGEHRGGMGIHRRVRVDHDDCRCEVGMSRISTRPWGLLGGTPGASARRTMWKDRALVELVTAVQHSFDRAGVTMADHHTESERFLQHVAREAEAGRPCPAEWSWIVPPISGSQTPVFHRYYETEAREPNFFTDDEATRRALEGGPPAFR